MIQWCSNCRDGGDIVICTACEANSICRLCVNFEPKNEEDYVPFECPPCFLQKSGDKPYVGLL